MASILAVVLAATVTAASQASSTAGSIVGCMSDMMSQPLPGAAVAAKGGAVERATVADKSGCYELKDLPPASYRVTAHLPGFDNVTRDKLLVAPSIPTRLDFTMRVSPICECVRVTGSLAEQWTHADAVLHVRLSESEPVASTPQGYYRHAVTVLTAPKEPAHVRPGPIFVIQNQRSGVPGPYDVGQELVVFLESSGGGPFRITNDEPGLAVPTGSPDPSMAFLVQDGHIQRAPPEFSRYVGMPIAAFLDELRTLSQRK
jgi:Carboxypeptidase regulatory-like domain